jgi:predicted metalloprotease
MNDQEIRMWAVQQVMNKYHDADQAIAEAEKLYQFVAGRPKDQWGDITVRCAQGA